MTTSEKVSRGVTRVLPTRENAVDLAMTLVLGVVAIYGFHDTYRGWTFLAAGALGLLLGALVAHLAYALKQPFIVTVVLTVVAFFLLGGAIALHGDGAQAVLPLPDTLVSLADQGVHGWKELLTTLPPVDGGPLLTLPYLLGLVAGAGGGAAALRLSSAWIPVLAPIALLSAVIVLGVQTPDQIVSLGAVFAVLAVGWLVIRARRLRRTTHFTRRRVRQRLTAAALVAGAAAIAVAVGPHLPGTQEERYVLRTQIEPPFDVGKYPSLLASFRLFRPVEENKAKLEDPLLTVTGLKPGSLIRFTTLNSYDGTVWGAANLRSSDLAEDDTYQKVGTEIDNPLPGSKIPGRVTVTVESGYNGVWLPTYGALRSIRFESSRLKVDADDFRYNIASEAGVMPVGLGEGDTYSFEAVAPKKADLSAATGTSGEPLVNSAEAVQFQRKAISWAGGAETPMAQVLAVAAYLKGNGTYTDGGTQFAEYHAGHSLKRLQDFTATEAEPTGNDEQYAATMALMANQLGVPARVVVGAQVPEDGPILRKNVKAWVELRVSDGSWQTLPTEAFMSTDDPPQTHSQQDPTLSPGVTVPPPVPVRPPSTAGDAAADSSTRRAGVSDEGFAIPGFVLTALKLVGIPLLLIGAVCAAIVAAKRERRKRRRTRGVPSRRLELAYRELLDQARDLGHRVYAGRTRREQALDIGIDGFVPLARAADAGVFSEAEPTDELASGYWTEVDRMRSDLAGSLTRWGRVKAALNLASFAPMRRREAEA